MKQAPDPLPKNIKIIQTVLALLVGGFSMFLWHGGIAGFFAFIITYSLIYVGIAVIYIKSQTK
ncbi:hypothetical protein [Lactococcus fujiensis]|uniref:Uncharacterized protein n=1 Tax=Lactococcus fujiensis JCM 16395 TaxID=1291764 RepID=A0A2A5RJ04_9LACT|nr:hypothetical protein [Lactococcus fujiensis]PCR99063.1 hypothetical protein RT41_GL000507 [Lactococcus fujiensis JCM 16395]